MWTLKILQLLACLCLGPSVIVGPKVIAPRHIVLVDSESKEKTTLFFHNSFGEMNALPCYRSNYGGLCGKNPRCLVDSFGDCRISTSYLSLISQNDDTCMSFPPFEHEFESVLEDLIFEGLLLDKNTLSFPEFCDLVKTSNSVKAYISEPISEEEKNLRSYITYKIDESDNNNNNNNDNNDNNDDERKGSFFELYEALNNASMGYIGSVGTVRPKNQIFSSFTKNQETSMKPPVKVGINGFGRIGRLVLRASLKKPDIQITHINCSMTAEYIKYLLEHDTTHGGIMQGKIEVVNENEISLNGNLIKLSNKRDPSEIPWADSGVEYVCESTGAFLTTESAMKHVNRAGGAKKVVLSAPAKDEITPTLVVGVNAHSDYKPDSHIVVSNASCTTNALAPIVKVVDDKFGFEEGLMTTVHAVTASQQVVDTQNKKSWRLGRSMSNIIPSTTGAAKAVSKCIPSMKGKLTGMSIRVPTIDVSVVDLTCRLKNQATMQQVIDEIEKRSQTDMKGIIGFTKEPIVSNDIIGNDCSTIFDATAGIELNSRFMKLITWYDNETGYATRVLDLIRTMVTADQRAVTTHTHTQQKSVSKHY